MNLLTQDSLPQILAQCFIGEARNGDLWVPRDMSELYADALCGVVRRFNFGDGSTALRVHIDTDNGTANVWELAAELERFPETRAEIGKRCKSAGLIIACACQYRLCRLDTEFLFHGSPYKNGIPDDRRKAQWFAERTTTNEDFWFDIAAGGADFCFGAEQALDLGVVQVVIA